MIFTQEHCDMILAGDKTQTMRRIDKRCPKVGDIVAVQPGRGKKAVGKVKVTDKEEIPAGGIWWLTQEQIEADGFLTHQELIDCLKRLTHCDPEAWAWNRIEFEVISDD